MNRDEFEFVITRIDEEQMVRLTRVTDDSTRHVAVSFLYDRSSVHWDHHPSREEFHTTKPEDVGFAISESLDHEPDDYRPLASVSRPSIIIDNGPSVEHGIVPTGGNFAPTLAHVDTEFYDDIVKARRPKLEIEEVRVDVPDEPGPFPDIGTDMADPTVSEYETRAALVPGELDLPPEPTLSSATFPKIRDGVFDGQYLVYASERGSLEIVADLERLIRRDEDLQVHKATTTMIDGSEEKLYQKASILEIVDRAGYEVDIQAEGISDMFPSPSTREIDAAWTIDTGRPESPSPGDLWIESGATGYSAEDAVAEISETFPDIASTSLGIPDISGTIDPPEHPDCRFATVTTEDPSYETDADSGDESAETTPSIDDRDLSTTERARILGTLVAQLGATRLEVENIRAFRTSDDGDDVVVVRVEKDGDWVELERFTATDVSDADRKGILSYISDSGSEERVRSLFEKLGGNTQQ